MIDFQTIPQAFAAWGDTEARLHTVSSEDWFKVADEQAAIEDAAVRLPVRTASEMWQLLSIVAKPSRDVTSATEELLRRAQAEASVAVANSTDLGMIFDRWLPLAEAAQMPDASEEQIEASNALAAEAMWLTANDPLDIWRKVAMALDITDRFHTGAAATLLREAGAALGIKADQSH